MKDHTKLRKLKDNELDKVSGGTEYEFAFCTICGCTLNPADSVEHARRCKRKDPPDMMSPE